MPDPIVEAVVIRYKKATESWFTSTTDQLPLDDAKVYIKDDTKLVRGYKAKCVYLSKIFRSLAGPLETPQIAVFADRIDKRVQDLDQLMGLVQEGAKLLDKAQGEFDQLIEDIADRKPRRGGLLEAIYDLPSIDAILKIALEAREIQDRFVKEDDDYHIEWVLEEYIGPESGIQRKIERAGESMNGWFTDRFSGVYALYGFVKYFIDTDYIQSMVKEVISDRGVKD